MLGSDTDKLIWAYKSMDGSVSASLAYRSLFMMNTQIELNG